TWHLAVESAVYRASKRSQQMPEDAPRVQSGCNLHLRGRILRRFESGPRLHIQKGLFRATCSCESPHIRDSEGRKRFQAETHFGARIAAQCGVGLYKTRSGYFLVLA